MWSRCGRSLLPLRLLKLPTDYSVCLLGQPTYLLITHEDRLYTYLVNDGFIFSALTFWDMGLTTSSGTLLTRRLGSTEEYKYGELTANRNSCVLLITTENQIWFILLFISKVVHYFLSICGPNLCFSPVSCCVMLDSAMQGRNLGKYSVSFYLSFSVSFLTSITKFLPKCQARFS